MFKWILFFLLITGFLSTNTAAQSYGLIFSSFEAEQERRTSLDLSGDAPFCLKKDFDLSFELAFLPRRPDYFGYVFRLINNKGQNIDLLYTPQNGGQFNLVFKEAYTRIDFTVGFEVLQQGALFRLHRDGNKLVFFINERKVGESTVSIADDCFRVFFGACPLPGFQTTDLPPMTLRNIALKENGDIKYYWPMKESDGFFSVDSVHHRKARVSNPVWVAPLHSRWKQVASLTVASSASTAFDPSKEEVYVVGKDSLYKYMAGADSMHTVSVHDNGHFLLRGNQSIYNPFTNFLYNFYIDQHEVAAFNPATREWSPPFDSTFSTAYWHSNKFLDAGGKNMYVLGGYGQLKYKNEIQRYNFEERTWYTVKVTGDSLAPRYLAALGTTASGDTAYILGGYGSKTGEQVLNPGYYYDCFLLDVKKATIKKLFTLQEPASPFVFASSLILDADGQHYYALAYPKDKYKSRLQLLRGTLGSTTYTLLADTIPYDFKDNKSYADLYFSASNRQLIAVTTARGDYDSTWVKIYSISFPPNELLSVVEQAGTRPFWMYLLIPVVLLLLVAVGMWLRRKKPETPIPAPAAAPVVTPQTELQVSQTPQWSPPVPAIFLFGSFEVIDGKGNKATKFFSPLLQELFLLIALYTIRTGDGISAEKLSEILWRDKSEKDASNNRSVNIAKLKNILDKVGHCSISKETGKWTLEYDRKNMYIDLAELLSLESHKKQLDIQLIERAVQVLKRGSLLQHIEYPWLDDIKSHISERVLNLLIAAGSSLPIPRHSELLIEIANCIFMFDQVNETALSLKCKSLTFAGRHSQAKTTYEKFVKDYREMYGEEFTVSFASIINE